MSASMAPSSKGMMHNPPAHGLTNKHYSSQWPKTIGSVGAPALILPLTQPERPLSCHAVTLARAR